MGRRRKSNAAAGQKALGRRKEKNKAADGKEGAGKKRELLFTLLRREDRLIKTKQTVRSIKFKQR
jgi:hypothetical protein